MEKKINNEVEKFSIKKRMNSFAYAFEGLKTFFATQHNSWIHLLATVVVIVAGYAFNVSTTEWCILIFAVAAVFITEMLNTAIEFLADSVTMEFHPIIKRVKDVSAAAVLVAAIASIAIAGIIFVPKLMS